MTTDTIMNRLRSANPARDDARTDHVLFDAIVATPGDRRLARRASARGKLTLRLAVLAVLLAVGVGAAWAGVNGALDLFTSNPQGQDVSPTSIWHQDVIPSSVAKAASIEIPRLGEAEFWFARTRQDGWCGAVRLPDGRWAGTKDAGGTVPGCYPTREQFNAVDPVFVINGFDYYEDQADARKVGGTFWHIYYGIVSGKRPAARVVDRVSGRSVGVYDGEAFAIALPDSDPERSEPLPNGARALHLVAYDAQGNVVADELEER